MNTMRRCKVCVYPETVAGLTFNKDCVCSACQQNEIKKNKIDWAARERKLKRILEEAKRNAKGGYDCIAPVSFGKDSTIYPLHP